VAAVIIVIVLWGIIDWPSGSPKKGKWWLGPPAAWSQEIIASLDRVQALVYRSRNAIVHVYGPTEFGVGWERRYYAKDAWRRDIYDYHDGTTIINTKWVVRDGETQKKVEVSYEYECYFEETGKWDYLFYEKAIEGLRRHVRRVDKADRILGTRIFDGRECVGFEISDAKYEDNLEGRFDVIWFDVETKLPARIEKHGFQISWTGHTVTESTLTFIDDQFEYFAEVPADLFEPNIPEGFINADPDEVRAARDRETKGEMVFADIPEGLTEEIVAAMSDVETGVYRDRTYHHGKGIYSDPKYVYLSESAWLIENYSGEELQTATWFITQQDADANLLELEGGTEACLLEEWQCDYDANTVRVMRHTAESPSYRGRHPMHHILGLVGCCGLADRFIEDAVIEGVKCFGFEISAKKYGDNRDGRFHRLWFDSETKLLVRTEFHDILGRRVTWSSMKNRLTTVRDQFAWNLEFPADVFEPNVPEGFIYIDPNEEQAARDSDTEEEKVCEGVPEGLIDELLAALKDVETGVYVITGESPYQRGPRYMYFSKNAWRKDYYSGEELTATRLWVVQHSDANLFELVEDNARVVEEWQYDYRANTVRVIRHTIEPGRPIY
jgi:outer membrane lipoprotein-sorting protein